MAERSAADTLPGSEVAQRGYDSQPKDEKQLGKVGRPFSRYKKQHLCCVKVAPFTQCRSKSLAIAFDSDGNVVKVGQNGDR